MTFDELQKANGLIKTTPIQGKEYAQVPERVKAFRSIFPEGMILTEIVSCENGVVLMKATVYNDDGKVLATGHAYEKEGSSFINKSSYIENCETSAVGRALGNAGFGIDVSIASAEEVQNAILNQTVDAICADCKKEVKSIPLKDGTMWAVANMKAYSERKYGRCLCADCMKKADKEKKENKE
ncbi:MAG: hypothetical protein IIW36_04375 [Clostridia bacterium]|jgi:ribosomal protein L34E|nr:hypothetical protein [Clostridia bacterium]